MKKILIILLLSLWTVPAYAGQYFCGGDGNQECTTDADCVNPPGGFRVPCPPCFVCNQTTNLCEPGTDPALCDDGSDCTLDACVVDLIAGVVGCENLSLPLMSVPPDPNFPIECYLCEPTANNVTVNNGVCEPAAGESCPDPDCQVPGEVCGPPPFPPPSGCDLNSTESILACSDGDRCTDDICDIGLNSPQCINPPKACSPLFQDGCCPSDCVGPNPADTSNQPCLNGSVPDPTCDLDCWYPQSCGDGLVQPPETCDDAADAGDAGISPTGSVVSNEQCRDPGEIAECTYCGDGILQTDAGEECEVGLIGSCGGTGQSGQCDLSTCQCVPSICVTGSGNPWDTIRPGCANCSLNKGAVSQGLLQDYRAFLLMAMILGLGMLARRRCS